MSRRTKAEIEDLKTQLYNLVETYKPMNIRQVYYQAVSRGLVDKTENQYKNTVGRLLGDMRKEGRLPFTWITDSTRWQRRPKTWNSLALMLKHSAKFYRRHLWYTTAVDVEIWLEKEALAGVLFNVTDEWDVPLMVTRGYPSLSFLYGAGEAMRDREWPTYIYYFGDFDPSGVDIPRKVEAGLREYSGGADIHFEVVAVNQQQIIEMNLPTRPTKKTDTRARNFEGGNQSVEVDAIDPETLRSMARQCIERHVDWAEFESLKRTEEAERGTLKELAKNLPSVL